ncbi:MAG: hypothetical protein HC910_03220 [Spirulinaceae cyanobacterium SM2_1_0]|nr:hypothetical protein [Spirulinaceae cyanobacterium SM2_1_0]
MNPYVSKVVRHMSESQQYLANRDLPKLEQWKVSAQMALAASILEAADRVKIDLADVTAPLGIYVANMQDAEGNPDHLKVDLANSPMTDHITN